MASVLEFSLSLFDLDQPSSDDEHCINMYKNGKWEDSLCSKKFRYLCEADPGTYLSIMVHMRQSGSEFKVELLCGAQ